MKRRYPDAPIVGVSALVIRKDKVLLVRRGKEPDRGRWSIPGGVIETGETIENALKREVFEECGVKIRVKQLLDVVEKIFFDSQGKAEFHYILLSYLADYLEGDIHPASDVLEVKWVGKEDIEKLDVIESVLKVLKEFFT
ncbi:MAG: NUDIX hydrolase [Candidatus Wukongarchaeota archaeon]|nr:NUDIX hydrolase [Candidatus Wukongarchaeota archaeon]